MNYISSPLTFKEQDSKVSIIRDIDDRIKMLDNLVELVVFTPRGTFNADSDFGFEYWDYEYSNVNVMQFNNNSTGIDKFNKESTKMRCQESVRRSLETYAPELKNVEVSMNLEPAEANMQKRRKVPSRHMVIVEVKGTITDGLETDIKFQKTVIFLIEPSAKRY